MRVESVPGAVAIATGAQASSLAIIRRRDGTATGTVALQSYPVASTTPRGLPARGPRSAPGTDLIRQIRSLPVTMHRLARKRKCCSMPAKLFQYDTARVFDDALAQR